MVRFNDKASITTLSGSDILPMTPLSDTSDDKKVTVTQLSQYTVDNISTLSGGKSLTTNDFTNTLKANYDEAYNNSILKRTQDSLLECPDLIKYENQSSQFTIKAGSILTKPSGTTLTLSQDLTYSLQLSSEKLVFTDGLQLYVIDNSHCFAGTTTPTSYTEMLWYDSTNNIIKYSIDSGVTWSGDYYLPLGFANDYNLTICFTKVTGYMGSMIWILKDTSVDIPNGLNSTGTYNNITYKTTSNVFKIFTSAEKGQVGLSSTGITTSGSYTVGDDNYVYDNGNLVVSTCPIGEYTVDSNLLVTKFQAREILKLATRDEIPTTKKFSTTLAVVSSNPDLTIQNSYSGTKDALGTETETLTYYQAEGNWTASTMPIDDLDWSSIVYGNGKFVAVIEGDSNCAYSTDGISWTTSTMPSAQYWSSVTYGNGKFVAIADASSNSAYSTDGINWTASTTPSSQEWKSVTYGNGKFVAIAMYTNVCVYSTDGISWTASTMPSSQAWKSVTYGNGKFVAIDNESSISAYSTDGITWTASTMPSSQSWRSVTYGNGKFVAIAVGTDVCAYSTDGITWTASTMPSSPGWSSITYGNGKFVAVAYNSDVCAYSTDGINWIASTMPSLESWYSITYGNGKFVAIVLGSDVCAYKNEPVWQNSSSQEVQLSDYQLSITSGTPVVNDTLGLTYTTTSVNSVLNFWTGNSAQYSSITNKDSNTQYNVSGKGLYLGDTEIIADKLSVSGNTNATSVDGQWVGLDSEVIIYEGSTAGSTELEQTISFLPEDSYTYEVIISANATSTSSAASRATVRSDALNNAVVITRGPSSSSSAGYGGTLILPITSSRKLYIKRYSGAGSVKFTASAYRRIGTNS